eukprot:scaffold269_cov404-Prasinococcus_capsulatus_cf.AAC.29
MGLRWRVAPANSFQRLVELSSEAVEVWHSAIHLGHKHALGIGWVSRARCTSLANIVTVSTIDRSTQGIGTGTPSCSPAGTSACWKVRLPERVRRHWHGSRFEGGFGGFSRFRDIVVVAMLVTIVEREGLLGLPQPLPASPPCFFPPLLLPADRERDQPLGFVKLTSSPLTSVGRTSFEWTHTAAVLK